MQIKATMRQDYAPTTMAESLFLTLAGKEVKHC